MGTIDRKGEPLSHPPWYYHDGDSIYFLTTRDSRKAKNMEQNERIYFCIDSDTLPYRGVKGKAIEMIVKDAQKAVELAERIITRYTGRVDNLVGRNLIPAIQSGTEIVIEVVPQYYSVWDYWKNNYG